MFSSNLGLALTEVVVYCGAVTLAFAFPHARFEWVRRLEAGYRRLAARRGLSVLFVIALALVLRGALIPLLPTPVPGVHDEYSYLLAGDTFASGRLANPPHPMWTSLETFYVIQQPTYASMYPPAQGLFLALGYLAGGHPWLGVYFSVALMCGAICWMLQGCVGPQWALMGGILSVLRLAVYSYWVESYWGGAVAALGGALAAGALARLIRRPSKWAALILGAGILILANSRPFEGLLFSLTLLVIYFGDLVRKGLPAFAAALRRVALPLAVLLSLGGAGMSYYFCRVTGSATLMPYELHSATYEVTGPFLWQPLRPAPVYRYAVMEQYHVGRQTAAYRTAHSLRGWLGETWRKAESLVIFYFWPAILPVLAAIPMLRRDRRVRFALITVAAVFIGLLLEIWPTALHYHAPLTAVMMLLTIQAMRFWGRVTWRGRPVGVAISRTIPLSCAAILCLRLGAAVLHIPMPQYGLAPWFTVTQGNLDRAAVERYLSIQPGKQLALVRYKETHHVDEEWVHNAADIDASKIVWAREANADENAHVLDYFSNRHAWLVEADAKPPRLISLSPAPLSALQSLK
jgi:hypothetical protein